MKSSLPQAAAPFRLERLRIRNREHDDLDSCIYRENANEMLSID